MFAVIEEEEMHKFL